MDLPPPKVDAARAIVGFPRPYRDASKDEAFIEAVKPAFPNLIARQLLPAEAPPNLAHIELASSSSRLTVSAAQAEFAVGFYGDFQFDRERAVDYVRSKLSAVLSGIEASGASPATVGVILTLQFSLADQAEGAGKAHIVDRHLREDVDVDQVQDANVRLALRVAGTHFASFTVSNYEVRGIERNVMAGVPIVLNAWEGEVTDHGIELVIDVNNKLDGMARGEITTVDETTMRATLDVVSRAALDVGPSFVASGAINAAALEPQGVS